MNDRIIKYTFYLLFLLVPIVLTPVNYELFEYNKMMLVYAATVIIMAAWASKCLKERTICIARTPLDIPIVLFLISQAISTIISIDHHVSLWGYYSRFNGGLISTISYILLYYAFVTNFPKEKAMKLIIVGLISGIIVSFWGILEHFGHSLSCGIITGQFDVSCWVQDVQNRVFATLGQPNWMAAYLAILLSISVGFALQRVHTSKYSSTLFWIASFIFFLTLIYTKSRSGFLGVVGAGIIFSAELLIHYKKKIVPRLILLAGSSIIMLFLFGLPFVNGTPLDRLSVFTLSSLISRTSPVQTTASPAQQPVKPLIEVGVTESGTIRKIVWKGALEILKQYPLFGSGVETFAFAYYKYRPVEHNMTSEWDFLYNKAHNEYLNYAATTGYVGIGTYAILILWFIYWNCTTLILKPHDTQTYTLQQSLFAAWISILITNFFGFSVVLIQLYFFLIPAVLFVLSEQTIKILSFGFPKQSNLTMQICLTSVYLLAGYNLYSIGRMWYADTVFTTGYRASHNQELTQAYPALRSAILLNSQEPLYADEFSLVASQLAVAFNENKDSTSASQLAQEAIAASNNAVAGGIHNVNYWKTRTRVFYALYQLKDTYLEEAMKSLEVAKDLSPTDPKVAYNLALIYDKMGRTAESVKEMERSASLKADYRDAYFALALFYERDNQLGKARDQLTYILTRLNPNDADAKKKLEELK